MLPRRCKKCSCYIAPHLDACPRCGKKSAIQVAQAKLPKPTKAEKAADRVKRDAKVPVIQGKNIHWRPSEYSLRVQTHMLEELKRRLANEESARGRNTVRSELRLVKAHLARATAPAGKKVWTTDNVRSKIGTIVVFISPKKHRYVMAERDDPADLIIQSAKKHKGIPFVRLQRFEKSRHARLVKKAEQEDGVHLKRKKEKKTHREKKRQLKRRTEQ